ncbi:hypothetical protein BpHYR1_048585 [Brachionus plicatilis]|uniref:Uncharacterized protein n=1 Tax=Brachionus plicatilis TaxID=10195 RepID=A0A3M7S2Q0_BRAPC|nr:hypothetical protein BpHYR1_048585 [Brachionus plicatilis]
MAATNSHLKLVIKCIKNIIKKIMAGQKDEHFAQFFECFIELGNYFGQVSIVVIFIKCVYKIDLKKLIFSKLIFYIFVVGNKKSLDLINLEKDFFELYFGVEKN